MLLIWSRQSVTYIFGVNDINRQITNADEINTIQTRHKCYLNQMTNDGKTLVTVI